MIHNKIFKALSLVTISNIIVRIIGFLFTVLVARYLIPEEYGQIILYMTILALTIQLMDLGVSTTYLSKVNEDRFGFTLGFIKIRIFQILISSVIFITLMKYLFSTDLKIIDFNLKLIIISFIGVILNGLLNVTQVYYQARSNFTQYAKIALYSNFLKLSLLLFLMEFIELNVEYIIYILCIAPITVLINNFKIISLNINNLTKSTHKNVYRKIFKTSKWIALSSIATTFMSKVDIIFIGFFLEKSEVGVYGVSIQFAMVISLISMSITSVLMPKISKIKDKLTLSKIRNLMSLSYLFLIPIVIFSYYMIPHIIILIFGIEYKDSIFLTQILVTGSMISLISNQMAIIYYSLDKAKKLASMNFIQLAMIITLLYILIPKYGVVGAAISVISIRIFASIYIYWGLRNL